MHKRRKKSPTEPCSAGDFPLLSRRLRRRCGDKLLFQKLCPSFCSHYAVGAVKAVFLEFAHGVVRCGAETAVDRQDTTAFVLVAELLQKPLERFDLRTLASPAQHLKCDLGRAHGGLLLGPFAVKAHAETAAHALGDRLADGGRAVHYPLCCLGVVVEVDLEIDAHARGVAQLVVPRRFHAP